MGQRNRSLIRRTYCCFIGLHFGCQHLTLANYVSGTLMFSSGLCEAVKHTCIYTHTCVLTQRYTCTHTQALTQRIIHTHTLTHNHIHTFTKSYICKQTKNHMHLSNNKLPWHSLNSGRTIFLKQVLSSHLQKDQYFVMEH